MYKRLTMALLAMALIVAVAVPLATLAGGQAGSQSTQGQTSAHSDEAKKTGVGERHPVIRRAMRQLENTKTILQKEAARDFEGHRAKAVEHINQALGELKLALQADKK